MGAVDICSDSETTDSFNENKQEQAFVVYSDSSPEAGQVPVEVVRTLINDQVDIRYVSQEPDTTTSESTNGEQVESSQISVVNNDLIEQIQRTFVNYPRRHQRPHRQRGRNSNRRHRLSRDCR